MNEENSASFSLTVTDLVATGRAFQSRSLLSWQFWLFVGIMAVAIAALAWLGSAEHDRIETLAIMSISGAVTLTCLVLVGRYIGIPVGARRHFRQAVLLKEELTVAFDIHQISLTNARSNVSFAWSEFHRWYDTADHFMLYQTSRMYNVIPKRALTAEQIAFMSECLERAGPERA